MRGLTIVPAGTTSIRILCVGAHCDDIEIGCGGALLELQAKYPDCRIDWVVLSGTSQRAGEAAQSMSRLIPQRCRGDLVLGTFPDGRMPSTYATVKDFFASLGPSRKPDLIFCHERDDRHQDHRIVNEMIWSTFRNHLVLEYEVPKWDGGLGQPNVYIPVARQSVDDKVQTLLSCYGSQRNKDWFTAETFLSLMRLRGLECRSPSGYAEAFHGRKIRLSFS